MVYVQEIDLILPFCCFSQLNFPPNACRYKDLTSVDVSDESFERLTFKPRKTRQPPQIKETKTKSPVKGGEVMPREPQLMDLYPLCDCYYAKGVVNSENG